MATLVLADPPSVGGRTFLLPGWLIETRSAAVDIGLLAMREILLQESVYGKRAVGGFSRPSGQGLAVKAQE